MEMRFFFDWQNKNKKALPTGPLAGAPGRAWASVTGWCMGRAPRVLCGADVYLADKPGTTKNRLSFLSQLFVVFLAVSLHDKREFKNATKDIGRRGGDPMPIFSRFFVAFLASGLQAPLLLLLAYWCYIRPAGTYLNLPTYPRGSRFFGFFFASPFLVLGASMHL
jgi:hypothetical protein